MKHDKRREAKERETEKGKAVIKPSSRKDGQEKTEQRPDKMKKEEDQPQTRATRAAARSNRRQQQGQ